MRALVAVGAAVAFAWVTATTSGGAVGAATAEEWQLHAAHVDQVPDAVLQSAATVKIAVIDTGADVTAPDLAARAPETWNTRTRSSDVRDVNGHGTFVASIVAAASGDAKLLVIKSGSDGGSFTDIDEAAGITYAVDHGARILNLSVGGPKTSRTERRAIQYAIGHGALVVTAVGNEGQSGNPVEYPAALVQPVGSDGAGGAGLAVTASTAGGRRAAFANTGSWVSLAAPGDHVLGALSDTSSPLLFPRTTFAGVTGLYGYGSAARLRRRGARVGGESVAHRAAGRADAQGDGVRRRHVDGRPRLRRRQRRRGGRAGPADGSRRADAVENQIAQAI
jgi:subtilisin family serine protease